MRCIKMKEADENLALEFNLIAWGPAQLGQSLACIGLEDAACYHDSHYA